MARFSPVTTPGWLRSLSAVWSLALLVALLVVVCSGISGCTEPLKGEADDYLARISRVTGEAIPLLDDSTVNRLPVYSVRQSRLALTSSQITLIDFLRLQSCQVAQALGHKNSQLGKVAQPGQVMHAERDILRQLPACIAALAESQPQLAAELQQAWQHKYQQRMAVWWNAWFTDEEWRQYLSGSGRSLEIGGDTPGHLQAGLTALDKALRQGQRWSDGEFDYDSHEMEQQLQQLLLAESVGRWLQSVSTLNGMLRQAAIMLQQTQQQRVLCRDGQEKKQASYLRNVFQQRYVAVIQPYLARTYRFGNEIMPRLQRIAELQPNSPQYQAWLAEVTALKQNFEQANLAHVKAWQAWLSECGAMPGQTPG